MAPAPLTGPSVGADGGDGRAAVGALQCEGQVLVDGCAQPAGRVEAVGGGETSAIGGREVVVALGDVGEGGAVALLRRVERGADAAQRPEAALVGIDEQPGVGRRRHAGAPEARPMAVPVGGDPTGGGVGRIGEVRHRPAGAEQAGVGVGPECGRLAGVGRPLDGVPPPAAPSVVLCAQSTVEPWQSFQTVCAATAPLGRAVPPALTTSGCEPGSSTASWSEPFVGKAVLGAGVARGGDHGLPLQGHALKDAILGLPVGGGHARLAHAPARRDDLCAVVAGDPVEEVERLGVAPVGRLVDD